MLCSMGCRSLTACCASFLLSMSLAAAEEGVAAAAAQATAPTSEQHRLFDVMFTGADRLSEMTYLLDPLHRAETFLTTDERVASSRSSWLTEYCCQALLTLLRQYSPKTDAYNERLKEGDLRQRVLICRIGGSTDFSLAAGDTDRVGDYVVVRESPHSTISDDRKQYKDADVLHIYLLADRAYEDGDLPPDFIPQLVHDVGGYLFANVEYFVATDASGNVSKADKKSVKAAGRSFMDIIVGSITRNSPPILLKNEYGFRKLAEDD
ncbi:MAG: hypothetical protein KBD01_08975 [Acidobacteria bacterium]|nr:hypothetical protein [Acidobacteriota bacterium]